MEVSYGNIKIDLRRSTNKDGFLREWIVERLKAIHNREDRDGAFRLFARVVSQIASAEGLPFAMPSLDMSSDELVATFDCWWGMDEDFGDKCFEALIELQRPVSEMTGPAPLSKDADPK